MDASNHTPRSLKNALTIMYSKEDILFKALQVNPSRVEQWCKKVRENVLEDIRKMPSGNMSMDKFRQLWYEERRMGGRSHSHYDDTRYYALNMLCLIKERWNGGVLTVPSMQEKYVQISLLL